MIDAVILAGTNNKNLIEGKNKFLLPLENILIGQKIIDICLYSKSVNRIVVVGPKEAKEQLKISSPRLTYIEEKNKFLQNALLGYDEIKRQAIESGRGFQKDTPILYVASDIPFISRESLDYFVEEAFKTKDSIYICHVNEKDIKCLKYMMDKPMMPFKEGRYKEGNIAIVRPEEVPFKERAEESYALRKQMKPENNLALISKIVRLGGFDTAVNVSQLMLRRYYHKLAGKFKEPDNEGNYGFLDSLIPKVSKAVVGPTLTKLMGCNVRIIETPFPELCLDIDSADEYQLFNDAYKEIKSIINARNNKSDPNHDYCKTAVSGK